MEELLLERENLSEIKKILPPISTNVPTCIIYDLEGRLIKKARIYMPADLMMKQLTN